MSQQEVLRFSLFADGSLKVSNLVQDKVYDKVNEANIVLAHIRGEDGQPQVARVVKMLMEDENIINIGKPSANLKIQEFVLPVVPVVEAVAEN